MEFHIPTPVLCRHVFHLLNSTELLQAADVCRQWREAANMLTAAHTASMPRDDIDKQSRRLFFQYVCKFSKVLNELQVRTTSPFFQKYAELVLQYCHHIDHLYIIQGWEGDRATDPFGNTSSPESAHDTTVLRLCDTYGPELLELSLLLSPDEIGCRALLYMITAGRLRQVTTVSFCAISPVFLSALVHCCPHLQRLYIWSGAALSPCDEFTAFPPPADQQNNAGENSGDHSCLPVCEEIERRGITLKFIFNTYFLIEFCNRVKQIPALSADRLPLPVHTLRVLTEHGDQPPLSDAFDAIRLHLRVRTLKLHAEAFSKVPGYGAACRSMLAAMTNLHSLSLLCGFPVADIENILFSVPATVERLHVEFTPHHANTLRKLAPALARLPKLSRVTLEKASFSQETLREFLAALLPNELAVLTPADDEIGVSALFIMDRLELVKRDYH